MIFYITTPIYYVNDTPHLGHAYCTIVADVLARYHKLFGDTTYFLTGTDEHGQKVQNAAKARNVSPQAHADEYAERFKKIWAELNIDYDIFMRTTFDYHKSAVQGCLQELYEKGDIYLDEYEGWYSVSEEIFYTEKDLINGKSPMGKEVTKIAEKNYFFKMSKYQERLIKYINENPDFIQPEGKKSEVLGFLRQPLNDLCISRPKSRLSWGIELPFDADYVTYVWFDALFNYATAIGYRQGGEKEEFFKKFWPHTVHLLGKDILTTHAVYWPTFLMGVGLPLPKQIFAHGWWLTDSGSKMSKSEGPVVNPLDMKDVVGIDALRYFLIREAPLGNDAQFSRELMLNRINADLANNLGNLASRALNIAEKNFEAKIPPKTENKQETKELRELAAKTSALVREKIEHMAPHAAIGHVIELLTAANKYIDTLAPWKAIKAGDLKDAAECIYSSLEVVRISAILLSPVMPSKMKDLLARIGWSKSPAFKDAAAWGLLLPGASVTKGESLFPRV